MFFAGQSNDLECESICTCVSVFMVVKIFYMGWNIQSHLEESHLYADTRSLIAGSLAHSLFQILVEFWVALLINPIHTK